MARKRRLTMVPHPDIEAAKTLRVAPVLSRVVYLHADGKTWECVPFQVFGADYGVVCVRIGENVYELSTVAWAEFGGRGRIGGTVFDCQPDPGPARAKYNRKALFEARHSGSNDDKPLLPRSDWRSRGERAEWEAEKRRREASERAYKRREAAARRMAKWKPSPAEERERKRHVGDGVFGPVLRPFVRRNLADARAAYRALCNIAWKRRDGRAYSCSWRHAGALVARLRDRNEFYLDFYCGGGEGRVGRRFRNYMTRRGWVPVEWNAWMRENGLATH